MSSSPPFYLALVAPQWQKVFPAAELVVIDDGTDFPMKYGPEWRQVATTFAASLGGTLLFGDQGNATFLREVAAATPGGFDVIIDDGGHTMSQQRTSLATLWPYVRPGGLYMSVDGSGVGGLIAANVCLGCVTVRGFTRSRDCCTVLVRCRQYRRPGDELLL